MRRRTPKAIDPNAAPKDGAGYELKPELAAALERGGVEGFRQAASRYFRRLEGARRPRRAITEYDVFDHNPTRHR